MSVVQEFNLNIIPDSGPVVIHVDQYDHGENRLVAHLYNGSTPYSPVGASVMLQGTKPDGNFYMYSATISGNTVTANLEEIMTQVCGRVRTQFVITDSEDRTGTFVFELDVQSSALNGAGVSESIIEYIQEAIEETQEKALESEAWAVGQRGGTDIPATDPAYHNNSKYYSEQAADSAEDSEAWAVGERDGVPVDPSDPTYHNNAKYYSEQMGRPSLAGLTDVTLTSLADDDILQYDSNSSKWVNVSGSGLRPGDMTGATAGAAGTHGLVPAPAAGDQNKVLNGDGTWKDLPAMAGATAGTAGTAGLVPAPSSGYQDKVLKGDGTWGDMEGGHTIINSAGSSMTQRDGLQFKDMGVTDDSVNNKTVVTLPTPDYVDDTFDPTHSYVKGETCISGNVRYEWINNSASTVPAPVPPNVTYWKVKSVSDELDELKERFDIYTTESTGSTFAGSFKNNITITRYDNAGSYQANDTYGTLKLSTSTTNLGFHRGFFKVNKDFTSYLGKNKVLFVNIMSYSNNDGLKIDCTNAAGAYRTGWGSANGCKGSFCIPLDSVISATYPYLILSVIGNNSGTDEQAVYVNNIFIM